MSRPKGISVAARLAAPWAFGLALALGLAAPAPARADDGLIYNRDVRPILAENCFACHGPDSAARKADLRLDVREAAVEMGAVEPGNPDESSVVARVDSTDKQEVMPPPSSHKTLTAEQKDVLRRWIAQGAEYQPHWSLIAPVRPAPPPVADAAWGRTPIDGFVLAGLEAKGLKPAPEADRRTLARRLSLDLTGLPPKPEEVEAFVADASPDAYEKYVDALLRSPAWGEHRGRYWLDAARYADTHGYHFDNYREMWSYRDWVINAFNANMPFDRFALEQIAGDLLPNRTLAQRVASGFNRCAMSTNEGGTIAEENLVGYTRDRTETVGQVFLGLTVGCAVCHDHKFDPISQKEFYELSAFFNNSTQPALDGNVKDSAPIVPVPRPEDLPRWEALPALVDAAKAEVDARAKAARPEFDAWLAPQTADALAAMLPAGDLRLSVGLPARDEGTPQVAFESAALGDFEKDQAFSFGAWIKVPKAGATGSVLARMDEAKGHRGWDLWLEGRKLATHIVHEWPGDALKAVTKEDLPADAWTHVFLTYDGSGKAAGVKIYIDGSLRESTAAADRLKGSIRTEVPLKVGRRNASAQIPQVGIADVRVHGRALDGAEVADLAGLGRAWALLTKPADKRPAAETDAVFAWWLASRDPASRELREKLAGLESERDAIKARGTIAFVTEEKSEEAAAFLLFRGQYDQRRDPLKAATPAALPPMPEELPRNRLGFAQWLLRPEHPLTSRVTVNRFWQELFGQGLVRTTGDLGVSGEQPSHPELLDWLAVEFRESGWDVKRFYKLLVTSAAYRQSAAATPEKLEADPSNRLISRGPRFRMDAEMVRDYALASSGLLVEKLGGPSVRPYQPSGVWEAVAMPESNTRNYKADTGEGLYRRSLYTFWKRAAPPASMDILNAPSREVCTVRRERTDTPLQALVTLNDPQFVEAARALAQRVLAESPDFDARADALARRVLARPLREEEASVLRESYGRLAAYYQAHPEDAEKLLAVGEAPRVPDQPPAEAAAWTMLANQVLNLDEVLNK
jgi:mono/diheme cytochrome c family protein